MRVCILARSALARGELGRRLRDVGIRAELLPIDGPVRWAGPTSGEPVLLVVAGERWDAALAAAVHALRLPNTPVYLVRAAEMTPADQAALLAGGVAEIFPDDEDGLTVLVAAVRWWMEQQRPNRLRLGALIFDRTEGELIGRTARMHLTDMERQLLWQLYRVATGEHPTPLPARELARRLQAPGRAPTTEDAIRTHAKTLRQKIEQDLQHPRLVGHIRGQGYILLLPAR